MKKISPLQCVFFLTEKSMAKNGNCKVMMTGWKSIKRVTRKVKTRDEVAKRNKRFRLSLWQFCKERFRVAHSSFDEK